MDSALAFAVDQATEDVAATIAWMTTVGGFTLQARRGGADAPFGNLVLDFGRGGEIAVRVIRDRAQWIIHLGTLDGDLHGLHVMETAMSGLMPTLSPPWDPGSGQPPDLPAQLPDGVSWRTTLPALIEWLSAGDRTVEVTEAADQWRQRMTAKRYGSQRRRSRS